ncbi:hypothetical protein D3C83_252920 [compost metagenome]
MCTLSPILQSCDTTAFEFTMQLLPRFTALPTTAPAMIWLPSPIVTDGSTLARGCTRFGR